MRSAAAATTVGREREVAAVVQVVERRQRQQRVELAGHGEAGQVEVQPAEVAQHVDVGREQQRRTRSTRSATSGSVAPACGTISSRSGLRAMRAVQHEVDDRAGGVEEELEHRPRPAERRVLPARRRRRVEKHACAAPVELAKDRLERRVAHVGAADVGEQHEAVDVEVVAAVRDLGDRGVDVGQRERREQPEAAGMVDHRAPAGLVHLAGELDGGRAVAEVHTGRRDRQQRRGDAEPVHRRHVLVGRPLRDRGHPVGLVVARARRSAAR